ncbi:MAG: hypothetical protein FJ280_00915 [Planctomycetes bacterium]|nr:hypothetical protein [Planctomycetota bacterium]
MPNLIGFLLELWMMITAAYSLCIAGACVILVILMMSVALDVPELRGYGFRERMRDFKVTCKDMRSGMYAALYLFAVPMMISLLGHLPIEQRTVWIGCVAGLTSVADQLIRAVYWQVFFAVPLEGPPGSLGEPLVSEQRPPYVLPVGDKQWTD